MKKTDTTTSIIQKILNEHFPENPIDVEEQESNIQHTIKLTWTDGPSKNMVKFHTQQFETPTLHIQYNHGITKIFVEKAKELFEQKEHPNYIAYYYANMEEWASKTLLQEKNLQTKQIEIRAEKEIEKIKEHTKEIANPDEVPLYKATFTHVTNKARKRIMFLTLMQQLENGIPDTVLEEIRNQEDYKKIRINTIIARAFEKAKS